MRGVKGIICMAISALISLLCTEASAQRTMRGQFFAAAEGGAGILPGDIAAGGVRAGQYLSGAYWAAGAAASVSGQGLSSGDRMEYLRISAYGDWMWRLAGTRDRLLSLYAGAGLFLGYEAYDPRRRLPGYIETGTGAGAFIYGARARLESEIFVIRTAAVTLGITPAAVFGSRLDRFSCNAQIGIRIML